MDKSSLSLELQTAIAAAKIGAKKALEYFNKGLKIKYKKDKSIVTNADRETEKIIKNYILSKFPKAKFVGEEFGGNLTEKELWIIDPIDGTRSFSRGIPEWCVLIAVSQNQQIVSSVVYFPLKNMLYYSQKGKGAFLNGKRVYVSKVNDIRKSYMGFGTIKYFKDKNKLFDVIKESGGARSFETTYQSCLVAEGKMDINLDSYGKLWDLAPFKLLIEEAGGKITRFNGNEWTLEGDGAIITNALLHDKVISIINKKV